MAEAARPLLDLLPLVAVIPCAPRRAERRNRSQEQEERWFQDRNLQDTVYLAGSGGFPNPWGSSSWGDAGPCSCLHRRAQEMNCRWTSRCGRLSRSFPAGWRVSFPASGAHSSSDYRGADLVACHFGWLCSMRIKNGFNNIFTSYLKQDKKASLKKRFSGKQNRPTIYLKYLMFNETGMCDSLPPTKLAILLPLFSFFFPYASQRSLYSWNFILWEGFNSPPVKLQKLF